MEGGSPGLQETAFPWGCQRGHPAPERERLGLSGLQALSSPRAGGGWQFSVPRSGSLRSLAAPAPAPGFYTTSEANFLRFPGAQELCCQATPPLVMALLTEAGPAPRHRTAALLLTGSHAWGTRHPIGTVPAVSPYFIRRPSQEFYWSPESAAHPFPAAFGRIHRRASRSLGCWKPCWGQ